MVCLPVLLSSSETYFLSSKPGDTRHPTPYTAGNGVLIAWRKVFLNLRWLLFEGTERAGDLRWLVGAWSLCILITGCRCPVFRKILSGDPRWCHQVPTLPVFEKLVPQENRLFFEGWPTELSNCGIVWTVQTIYYGWTGSWGHSGESGQDTGPSQ